MKPQPRHLQAGLTLNKQYSAFQPEVLSTHKMKQRQHKLGFSTESVEWLETLETTDCPTRQGNPLHFYWLQTR
jgi:hypothetical protein